MFQRDLPRFHFMPENFFSTVRETTMWSLRCVLVRNPILAKLYSSESEENKYLNVSLQICLEEQAQIKRVIYVPTGTCWKKLKMTHPTGMLLVVLVGCFNIRKAYKTVCHHVTWSVDEAWKNQCKQWWSWSKTLEDKQEDPFQITGM